MEVKLLDDKKILLVEDEPFVIDMYKRYLEGSGALVTVAESGEQGIENLAHENFDLVILDRILTGKMTGFDVLTHMRDEQKLTDIPVVVLTNLNLEPENEGLIEKYNVAGYYVKADISLDSLSLILSELTSK